MTHNDADDLLAELRGSLANAPHVNDLELRIKRYRIVAARAVLALTTRQLTQEQTDAFSALNTTAIAGRDATALALPPSRHLEIC